jgi:predicted nucleotidyltransferase
MAIQDPILERFRYALNRLYGSRVERVVLFGSRARGDNKEDSDYDIAVFLKDLADWWDECGKIAEITTDIMADTGIAIHAMAFSVGAYREPTFLMQEIQREGVDV